MKILCYWQRDHCLDFKMFSRQFWTQAIHYIFRECFRPKPRTIELEIVNGFHKEIQNGICQIWPLLQNIKCCFFIPVEIAYSPMTFRTPSGSDRRHSFESLVAKEVFLSHPTTNPLTLRLSFWREGVWEG